MRSLLIGARSMLAQALSHELDDFDWVSFSDIDSVDVGQYERVINCVAFTDVDGAEKRIEEASAINEGFVQKLISRVNGELIHYSTDYVFDGKSQVLYTEDAESRPLNVYGKTKLAGEKVALASGALVIRTSWVYGLGKENFVSSMLKRMQISEEVMVVSDQVGTPTYTTDLAKATIALSGQTGLFHFANETSLSRFEWVEMLLKLAQELGITCVTKKLIPVKSEVFKTQAMRPSFSSLASDKAARIIGKPRSLRSAMKDYLHQLKARGELC